MIAATAGAVTQSVQARPIIVPYVRVSVSPENLDLGSIPQPGVFDSPATLTVHVAANTVHGGVVVSMAAPLVGPGEATIPLARTWVKMPVSGEFVALTAPVIVTGPMGPGVVDIPLKFRVETDLANRPGTYSGTLVVTCGVAP